MEELKELIKDGHIEDVLQVITNCPVLLQQTTHYGDWFDLTALHVAILANQQVICKYLIEMRADLEAKAKKGGKWSDLTPLHVAVIASSAAICRLLIEMGADVNAKAQKGFVSCDLIF
eukprot:c20655_g1_i6.p1 GENE.c20655_g1_i6~~c20655_g1_i6.p1  ORF type:complete len:118 (+),score=29.40 c20655_g1_i6:73-426(+)